MNERGRLYSSRVRGNPTGSRMRPRYIKDRSTVPPTLKKVGETDQYGFIQSFKDCCDVNKLVERASQGDLAVLRRVQGLYFDSTAIPDQMIDLMALGKQAVAAWDNLNPEIKKNFADVEEFKNAIINGDFSRVTVKKVDDEKSEKGGISE